MESWQVKQSIYDLISGGYANEKTVARLINAQDIVALRRYLDTCRHKRDRQYTDVAMEDHFVDQVAMCRRWIDESYQESGQDKESTRQRIGKLKKFAEDFGLTKAMRQAWRQKFNQ